MELDMDDKLTFNSEQIRKKSWFHTQSMNYFVQLIKQIIV